MGLLIISLTSFAGFLCFRIMDWLEPVHELEYWFYAIPYTSIGTVTGFAAWYFARLVARDCMSLALAATILLLPYAFIMSLALELNPFVAAVATAAFGFILFLSCLAHASRHRAFDSAKSPDVSLES